MTYLIIYLILNQLARIFVIQVAITIGEDDFADRMTSFRALLFYSLVGLPVTLVALVLGLLAFVKED